MEDKDYKGRLVYLTVHLDAWLRRVNFKFNIPMVNRLAKVIKVFDWDTEEGKLLLAEREKTGKWVDLESKDFKFVLKIYYPELKNGDKTGMCVEELMPRCYPGSDKTLFDLIPAELMKDLIQEEKEAFKVVARKVPEVAQDSGKM